MVNFDYYIKEYNGQRIRTEDEFKDCCKLAEKYVLNATDNRGNEKEIGEAICAVCDVLFEVKDTEGIKSEAIDGVSIIYENKSFQNRIFNTLKLYLPSRLLYRGI